jgi:2-dehydro-3-deoxy-D-gluconate 5-dehydrogenase
MILGAFSLEGKVAIVTGARTGLGQGMALGLAEAGADIVGIDLTKLDETEEGVKERGKKFLGIEADLSNIKAIDNILHRTIQGFKKIDILVNNAGIIRRTDAIDFSEKDWDEVMAINLKTVFFLSQAVAKQFIKQNTGGKIISVASLLSFQGG